MLFNRIYLTLALLLTTPAYAQVVDGDTLKLQGQKIRLLGIDAPERQQTCRDGSPCGKLSTDQIRTLIGPSLPYCTAYGRDKYQRVLAECFANAININREMVRTGWAIPYRGDARYGAEHAEAIRHQRGIYRHGGIEEPHLYRKRKKR